MGEKHSRRGLLGGIASLAMIAGAGEALAAVPSIPPPAINAASLSNAGGALTKQLVSPKRLHIAWVACNSIGANGWWATGAPKTGFSELSEINYALQLAGPQFYFKYAGAATSTSDIYGNYGYAGQTSSTILADMIATWLPQMLASGSRLDVAAIQAFCENDIAGGVSFAAIQANYLALIAMLRGFFPGIRMMIGTPHQDSRVNTAPLKAVWNSVHDWLLTLDNGVDIFIADLCVGGYGTTADRTQPKNYYTYISVPSSEVVGVHPQPQAAKINARIYAAALIRIASTLGVNSGMGSSGNPYMTGASNVTTPTGHSGTMPNNASFVTPISDGGTLVSTASNPGAWNIAYTLGSTGTNAITARLSYSTNLPKGKCRLYCKVQLVSGSVNIADLIAVLTFAYTSGSPANDQYVSANYQSSNPIFGSDPTLQAYRDGDILYLMTPDIYPNTSGVLATVYTDVQIWPGPAAAAGNTINLNILEMGVVDEFLSGQPGETQQATVASGASVSLTTGTPANVTSKLFAAGEYMVWGNIDYNLTAATTSKLQAAISKTSATLPTQAGGSGLGPDPLAQLPFVTTTLTDTVTQQTPMTYLRLAVPTTVFLVAQVAFSAGTVAAYGTLEFVRLS